MKSNKRNNKGISLIVLVITMIIMIVLAGAIILSLSGTGLITNANKAAFQNDIATMQEELGEYIANKITETKGKYTQDSLLASKSNLEENGAKIEGKNIKDVLTSIDKKYLDEVEIINGKVVYVGDDLNKIKWANEILLGLKNDLKENTTTQKVVLFEKSKSMSIVNYRIYGNSKVRTLPAEYQQVEYIESTGTQYIDTGYYANFATRVVADYEYTGTKSGYLYGATTFDVYCNYTSKLWDYVNIYYGNTDRGIGTSDTQRHIIDHNQNMAYLDGVLKVTYPEEKFYITPTFEIFAKASGATLGSEPVSAKVYSFKIYDKGKLVRDLIPCYRISDNVIGLYDVVNNKFYINQGTGNFGKGANVSDKYQEVQSVGDLIEYGEYKGKYAVNIKTTGKNVLDLNTYYPKWVNDEGGLTYSNIEFHLVGSSGYSGFKMHNNFKENTQYVWSFDYEITDMDANGILAIINYTDGTTSQGNYLGTYVDYLESKTGHEKIVSEAGKTISSITLSYNARGRTCNVKLSNMMIEMGNKETEYEAYEEKVYTIYLDEPLRNLDNYVDYIDFRTQEVVRNVEEIDGGLKGLASPKREKITLPEINLNKEQNSMYITTTLSPSKIETLHYTK